VFRGELSSRILAANRRVGCGSTPWPTSCRHPSAGTSRRSLLALPLAMAGAVWVSRAASRGGADASASTAPSRRRAVVGGSTPGLALSTRSFAASGRASPSQQRALVTHVVATRRQSTHLADGAPLEGLLPRARASAPTQKRYSGAVNALKTTHHRTDNSTAACVDKALDK
jgi:hypothetical protein